MPVIATENFRFSNVVKHEYEPSLAYCRDVIVVDDSAQDLVIGTVLGKVTADGKYKVSVETAVDGSETPAAVCLVDQTIAAVDTDVLAMTRGPAIVSNLVLDASYDNQTKIDAANAALVALGILVQESV